ncbi:MAG: hypothetical protein K5790_08190 [Nitrosopumilus sp.]|uniref:hypothetical protein n=1 Tax=Nitrosopumilus sp. TaxID=2024843 RepID=UPI00247DBB23|nr:hypothetical protein [Nitrosopumilus sp.]MCV0393247.1 hypothetical protein [Nitrosopumilus sp.]
MSIENSFAESNQPILITQSIDMDRIIFDGKWTFITEWKPTSLTKISLDHKQIILRTAHFENFIYVLVDSIDDYTLDKGIDKATICFDGNNEKNNIADNNDFCFSSTLGNSNGISFQGGSVNALTGHFQKISNPDGFIAISDVSDENDRYTKIPHPSYEFKIPLDLLGRSDNYGFYLSVYDGSSNTFYSFPEEITRENLFKIPPPSQWGDILSPDKSLPELSLPILIFTVMFISVIIIQIKIPLFNFR